MAPTRESETPASRQLRVLIVGAGDRGRQYTKAFTSLGFIHVTGVADPLEYQRNRVKKLAGPNAAIKEYKDYREALDDADSYDAVAVTVLDKLHSEVAVAFADKKKHILCEKPLATSWQDCEDIYNAVKRNGVLLAVGHVLRYTPLNLQLKKLLDEGTIGKILNINHTEPVGWYHFAHSFVRGNWGREDTSTFSLMSKCCHDIDILMWFLGAQNFKSVSSFGHLSLFKKENKPAEAEDASRCLDCPIEDSCPYSATSLYLRRKWKTDAVVDIEDDVHITEALKSGPYGRCAYECDNTVCDNQVVNMDFGGATAVMTMIATSEALCQRKVSIYGSKGEIYTDYDKIRVFDFSTETAKEYRPSTNNFEGHGGGDTGLAMAFANALRDVVNGTRSVEEATVSYIGCTPEDILASHKVVFLAEKARRENRVATMADKL